MKTIYLYPITARNNTGISNPYISLLAGALSSHFTIINYHKPSNFGIFDILKYFGKIDIVYLNWIEDIREKKHGFFQVLLFLPLFAVLKLSKKKVVWTLHNKKSHSEKYVLIKNLMFKMLLKHSDLILTHAEEGIKYIPERTPKVFIPHPVNHKQISNLPRQETENDIIIWGSITKYKGIDSFISFLVEENIISDYNLLIAGKIVGKELELQLGDAASRFHNIKVINKFLDENDLIELIQKSKIILFTYHSESILSSGALMDSLHYNSRIVGPDVGAFQDLAKMGIVNTFKDYPDLIKIINTILESKENDTSGKTEKTRFIEENTWGKFPEKILPYFSKL